jgi:hypothetical protein
MSDETLEELLRLKGELTEARRRMLTAEAEEAVLREHLAERSEAGRRLVEELTEARQQLADAGDKQAVMVADLLDKLHGLVVKPSRKTAGEIRCYTCNVEGTPYVVNHSHKVGCPAGFAIWLKAEHTGKTLEEILR